MYEQLASKQGTEDSDRKKKVVGSSDPATAIERQAPTCDDTMRMRMKAHISCPGMQHRGHAELCCAAEPLRIAAEREQRVGCAAEQ